MNDNEDASDSFILMTDGAVYNFNGSGGNYTNMNGGTRKLKSLRKQSKFSKT